MSLTFTDNFLGTTSGQLTTESFKVSVVDYTQKVSEDWHWHEKLHISSIIRGGNLESRKNEEIQVVPSKILVYQQGEIHRNRFTVHPSKNINIEFEEHFFNHDICFSNLTLDENSTLDFFRIYLELQLNDQCSQQSIGQILQSLFWQDNYESKGEWIQKLKELLNDRWDEFPSLNDLSNELNVHPITISKYFAKENGMTLSEYMRKIKVRRAVGFLMNSSSSLAEIAFTCGFSDQSHMSRLVKNYTGYTPGTIRTLS